MKVFTHSLLIILAVFLVLSGAIGTAQAQELTEPLRLCERQKLLAQEQDDLDVFGGAVAVSGDVAIVGAWNDQGPGVPGVFTVGAAYIFRRDGETWEEEQKLSAPDRESEDFFGFAVAVSEDLAVIGVPRDDEACPTSSFCDSGSAYIFRFDGSEWVFDQKLVPADTEATDQFGLSVAVDGEVVVVGAPWEDDACGGSPNCNAGAAYVFRYDDESGLWVEEQKLMASDPEAVDQLGFSVGLSGNRIVAGAHTDDDYGVSSGSAYVFIYDDERNAWTEEQKLTASDAELGDFFGFSVDMEGDRIIVGSKFDDDACPENELCNSGSVYVFRNSQASKSPWVEEGKLTASDAAADDEFGEETSISGDRVVVGRRFHDGWGDDAGAAYLFEYDSDSEAWSEVRKFAGSEVEGGDRFGEAIAIDGDSVIVGAASDDDAGNGSGAAYVFDFMESCPSLLEDGRYLAVTSRESPRGPGFLRLMRATEPFTFVGPSRRVDPDAIVRYANDVLYVVNPLSGTVEVFHPDGLEPLRTYSLGRACQPRDIAVIDEQLAYVTCGASAQLLKLDLQTGDAEDSIDLSLFADEDGNPDQGLMIEHEGRLFVQLRRLDDEAIVAESPAMLAVVDLASGTLLDVDPVTPGTQAIELRGTYPRFKMQIVPETNDLYVSATGAFFDEGGIERIDLDTLESTGLAIREADGQTGADLGAFVFVTPETGFLTFSTDLLLSSHLSPYSLSDGLSVGPELHVSLDYFVPLLLHDPVGQTIFYPEGRTEDFGIHVFDALTGERLTREPIATSGQPTDMALFCLGDDCDGTKFIRGDCDGDGQVVLTDAVRDLRFCFGGATVPCAAACDADGDGNPCSGVNDGIYLLNHLFRGGEAPPAPFPGCGADPSVEGDVDCATPPAQCQ